MAKFTADTETTIYAAHDIACDGLMFRAIGPDFRGPLVSSAAAAGKMIAKRFGKEALANAVDAFFVRQGIRGA
jgi:hypothetical protein